MSTEPKDRSHLIGEAIQPLLIPGDVALVVGADDSRTLFWGDANYAQAYPEGARTAKQTYWAVFLAFKLLLENMEFHKKYFMPKEEWDTHVLFTEPRVEEFEKAKNAGILMPENTFRILCGMAQEFLIVLEGHMAACMPNEFRTMVGHVEELRNKAKKEGVKIS